MVNDRYILNIFKITKHCFINKIKHNRTKNLMMISNHRLLVKLDRSNMNLQ